MSTEKQPKLSKSERLAIFGRNINILGAVALGGVALIIPGPNAVLATLASINAAQAGGFELWRQSKSNKNKSQKKS